MNNNIILIPTCNSCNKPHYGMKKSIDRCICDTSGNFRMCAYNTQELDGL